MAAERSEDNGLSGNAAAQHGLSSAGRQKLLERVQVLYEKSFHRLAEGKAYLTRHGITDPGLWNRHRIGYCSGTMTSLLPPAGEAVDGLKALGVLTDQGEERLRGCVTFPIVDSAGAVCAIWGRRIPGEDPADLHVPPGHPGAAWNGGGSGPVLFVTQSILDGLSLCQAGFESVIALVGVWTAQHETRLRQCKPEEVFLCLGSDPGERETERQLREGVLPALGISVHTVCWPEGVKNANSFFLRHSRADFEVLLAKARPGRDSRSKPKQDSEPEEFEQTPEGFVARWGQRRYELRAIEQPNPARLRATVKVTHPQKPGRFHIDTVDFYLSRSRRALIGEAALLSGVPAEVIETDLNRIMIHAENYLRQRQTNGDLPKVQVGDEDRAEGLRLGRHPDLAGEIGRDLERLGLVGESVNKLISYLVMTSRKMDDPLALLILSGSGAGKSLLQDTVLKLCPEEDLVKLTSLSDRALFYKGPSALTHRVLAIEESAGAEGASYAIRNLISARKLVIETTVRNPLTGKLETQLHTVHGPTAVFQTTTRPDLHPETRSRFILTSIDESEDQTRAILRAQRQSHTLEGLRRKRQSQTIIRRHHAFQRLLKPATVVNPLEPLLTHAEDRLLMRRDQPKYLNLILAVTFLHQYQRPRKQDEILGDYIETTLEDIALAHKLATALFGQSLDDLSRPGRELLGRLLVYVQAQAIKENMPASHITFTRREVRESLRWSEYQLRTYLRELAELEYVCPTSGRQGQPFRYRLLYTGEGESGQRFLVGLKSVEQLRQEARQLGLAVSKPASRPESELRAQERHFADASMDGCCQGEHPATDEAPGKSGPDPLASRASGKNHVPTSG